MTYLIKEAKRLQQLAGIIQEDKEAVKRVFFKRLLMAAFKEGKLDQILQKLNDDYSISFHGLSQASLENTDNPQAMINSEIRFSDWDAIDSTDIRSIKLDLQNILNDKI